MSGELKDTESVFISAPIDGLNLRLSPYQVSPTEAIQLDNYLVYDWGIRECGNMTSITNPEGANAVGQIVFFKNASGTSMQLICVNNKIYSTNSSSWTAPTNLTGALTITTNAWRYNFFNKNIFLYNGTDAPLAYDIVAGTLAAAGWTGPTVANLIQGWNYKQRQYAVLKNSTSFYYGGVGSITGAVTQFDIGQFTQLYGNLLFGTTWSVNQGDTNEDMCVLVTDAGEILLYSGDYPAAANWQLKTRVQIPMPVGNQAFINFGQDVLIATTRGVISLRNVISAQAQGEQYYNVSFKLANAFGSANVPPIKDPIQPFIYFPTSDSRYVYALNYERGAWSRIDTSVSGSTISAMSFFDTGTEGKYFVIGYASGTVQEIDDTAGNTATHAWRSGFLSIEPKKQKAIKMIRVLGRNISGTGQFVNTVAARMDTLSGNVTTDSRTTAIATTAYIDQELFCPGIGKRPSIIFTKTSTGEQNELAGYDLFFKMGGVH